MTRHHLDQHTLYSLRTDGDQYRITKIVDGEVESSYLMTETECTCPAGHRPSCRHRQMIPEMLARGLCNTHWFWDFDIHRVVDFNGTLKSNLDALNELAAKREPEPWAGTLCDEAMTAPGHTDLMISPEAIAEAVGEAPPSEVIPQQQKPSWRRL